jgi:cytochrome c
MLAALEEQLEPPRTLIVTGRASFGRGATARSRLPAHDARSVIPEGTPHLPARARQARGRRSTPGCARALPACRRSTSRTDCAKRSNCPESRLRLTRRTEDPNEEAGSILAAAASPSAAPAYARRASSPRRAPAPPATRSTRSSSAPPTRTSPPSTRATRRREAMLIDKVKKGGVGVWGQVPMPPNSRSRTRTSRRWCSGSCDQVEAIEPAHAGSFIGRRATLV